MVQIINILTVGLLTSRLQTKGERSQFYHDAIERLLSLECMIILELWNIVGLGERDPSFIMMQLSDYVVSGMHDNLGTLEHCGARGERCGFIMMLLSDYVVSGMHDNLGTLEHCGARCKQCLLLARYLNHHHEGARVETEL